MDILFFEILSVFSLSLMTSAFVYEFFQNFHNNSVNEKHIDISSGWSLMSKQIGTITEKKTCFFLHQKSMSTVPLTRKSYLLGNRRSDDLQLPIAGKHICCYLNIQHNCIYLTVISGAGHNIFLNGNEIKPDSKIRFNLSSGSTLRFDHSIELAIQRN